MSFLEAHRLYGQGVGRRELPGHDVHAVNEMGWSGSKMALLRRAAQESEAFLTVDQGLEYQQSVVGLDLAVE